MLPGCYRLHNLFLCILSPDCHQQGKVKTAALSPHYCSEIPREMMLNFIQNQGRTKRRNKGPKPVPLKLNAFFSQYTSIQNTCFSLLLGSKPCHIAACTVLGHMVSNVPWSYTYHKNSTGRIILKTSLMGQKYLLEEADCESTYWGCYLVQQANSPAVQPKRWIALKT